METKIKQQHFEYKDDRLNKFWTIIILICSIFVFLFTVLGLTDWLSDLTSSFLLNNLGYTSKWTKSYGPEWFVNFNSQVTSLGSFSLIFIFTTVALVYYYLSRESRRFWRLLFIIIVGGVLLLINKIIFSPQIPEPFEIITNQISTFPSGHAMMGTIFYITLAVTIARTQNSRKIKRLIVITGIIITLLIGISRILPGTHTVTEVLAGWSLGLIWLCLCWILEKKIKLNLNERTV